MNEMIREKLFDQVLTVLKDMDDSELVNVWNEYCERVNYYDDRIESMDMLDELFDGDSVTNILNRAFFGNDQFNSDSSFNPNRDYFTFNGYGNLVSLECIGYNEYADKFMYSGLDIDAVIDYILDNMDALESDEITDILDDYENGID